MTLSNEQYDALMREYEEKRRKARAEKERRLREIREKIPAYAELDAGTASAASAFIARFRNNENASPESTTKALADIRKKREALLTEHGFPADYADAVYACEICKDTGFTDGKKCRCFKNREIEILFAQSNLRILAGRMNFPMLAANPMPKDYSEDDIRRYESAVKEAKHFADVFPRVEKGLLFMGNVGTGKTTLSVCVADALLKKGFSVLYFSAPKLFEELADARFAKEKERGGLEISDLSACDLLVIDDLGTEIGNAFVTEQLFELLNERDLKNRRTVISTNLDFSHLQGRYEDRIFSRMMSGFDIYKLTGPDLRRAGAFRAS